MNDLDWLLLALVLVLGIIALYERERAEHWRRAAWRFWRISAGVYPAGETINAADAVYIDASGQVRRSAGVKGE